MLLGLPFAPTLTVLAASGSPASLGSSTSGPFTASSIVCEDDSDHDNDNVRDNDADADTENNDASDNDNDKNDDKNCPPPVVPEAPLAVLLPLSAGTIIAGAFVVTRLRSRS